MKHLYYITLLAIIITSCNSTNRDESENEILQSDVIATIDNLQITDNYIIYKSEIEKAYGNSTISRLQSFIMLTNDMIEYILLRKQNKDVLAYELQALKNHTFATSKAPEILNHIQKIFVEDTNSFNQLFFRPIIVNQKLNEFFYLNKELHKEPVNKIQDAFSKAKLGKSFKQIASDSILQYVLDTISSDNGIFQIANYLQTNQIYSDIIESDYSFSILKVIRNNNNNIVIESVAVAKNNIQNWMQNEVKSLDIKMYDEGLYNLLKTEYPDLYWTEHLQLNFD